MLVLVLLPAAPATSLRSTTFYEAGSTGEEFIYCSAVSTSYVLYLG